MLHNRNSSRWLPFTSGVLVGVAASVVALSVAVAAARARRQAEADTLGEDQELALDEALAQTFPASDPLPAFHHVD